jgi:hypothetical protein
MRAAIGEVIASAKRAIVGMREIAGDVNTFATRIEDMKTVLDEYHP